MLPGLRVRHRLRGDSKVAIMRLATQRLNQSPDWVNGRRQLFRTRRRNLRQLRTPKHAIVDIRRLALQVD